MSDEPVQGNVKIKAEDLKDTRPPPPKSILNDMRLKEHENNMQRDP